MGMGWEIAAKGCAEAEEQGKENLCLSQCVCHFCVSVSFERMWNDSCWDSSLSSG